MVVRLPIPTTVSLHYRVGADNFVGSTSQEEIVHFMALTEPEVRAASSVGHTW